MFRNVIIYRNMKIYSTFKGTHFRRYLFSWGFIFANFFTIFRLMMKLKLNSF